MSQLDELRSIIVGENADQLNALQERIEDVEQRTKDVSEVLSPAILKEVSSEDSTLADSLQQPVSLGLKRAIRSEPEEYAEILYPVMGPSIRRAIAQAISSMMVTMNRTIESATTVQGLKMRYEAMRTGVPYAELALRRTFLYRVEHLYLIHQDTGMAMTSLHADDTESLDSDAVSSMFSAIQSFIQDSFSADESSRLTDLKVGDQNVWVAHGPKAMLACVIRGEAPEAFKRDLYDALDSVRIRFANEIAEYAGDPSLFDKAEDILSPLLQVELKENDDESPSKAVEKSKSLGTQLLMLGGVALAAFLILNWFLDRSELSTVRYVISQTPGITATNVYHADGQVVIEGLKDPDAIIPYQSLNAYGIEESQIKFDTVPIRSLDIEMESQRFNQEFSLPEGLKFEANKGQISLIGKSPYHWLRKNKTRIQQLAADGRLSIDQLSADEQSVRVLINTRFLSAKIETIQVGSTDPLRLDGPNQFVEVKLTVSDEEFAPLLSYFSGDPWVTLITEIR